MPARSSAAFIPKSDLRWTTASPCFFVLCSFDRRRRAQFAAESAILEPCTTSIDRLFKSCSCNLVISIALLEDRSLHASSFSLYLLIQVSCVSSWFIRHIVEYRCTRVIANETSIYKSAPLVSPTCARPLFGAPSRCA
jgi:hypothetical protein